MARVLGIGHSHLGAILRAAAMAAEDGVPFTDLDLAAIQLRQPEYQPLTDAAKSDPGAPPSLNPVLLRDVRARLVGREMVFLCLAGNAHNILGLTRHPRPFDFVLDERPDLPLLEDAEIMPEAFIRDALARHLWSAKRVLQAFCEVIDPPMAQLESPPPIPSEAHLGQYPGVFAQRMATHGVAAPWLRYKLWRVHSSLMRAACADCGIAFVPVPAETLDEDGFLIERAWSRDPTHGNAWYGARVIEQLRGLVPARGEERGEARTDVRTEVSA